MSPLTDLTLSQAVQALRQGEVSSRELTQACLERIERLETALHAFLSLQPEEALRRAAQADQALAAWRRDPKSPLPPLTGLPIAVKDVLCVQGFLHRRI